MNRGAHHESNNAQANGKHMVVEAQDKIFKGEGDQAN